MRTKSHKVLLHNPYVINETDASGLFNFTVTRFDSTVIITGDEMHKFFLCTDAFCNKSHIFLFFLSEFFQRHWRFTRQQGKGRDHALFLSATSTRSQIFRYSFAILHVRWLLRIFNRIACNYQAATRRVLSPYWITILIDWWCNVSFCLFTWWFNSKFIL